jgi:hypothetical protein
VHLDQPAEVTHSLAVAAKLKNERDFPCKPLLTERVYQPVCVSTDNIYVKREREREREREPKWYP